MCKITDKKSKSATPQWLLAKNQAQQCDNNNDDNDERRALHHRQLSPCNTMMNENIIQSPSLSSSSGSIDPFIVIGINLSTLHPNIQFYICAVGVFGFTIVYAYLQELLSVTIMSRDYALFISLCQLAGYSFWSNILMYIAKYREEVLLRKIRCRYEHEYETVQDVESAVSESKDSIVKDVSQDSQSDTHEHDDKDHIKAINSISSNDTETNSLKDSYERDDKYPTNDHGPSFIVYFALSLIRAFDIGLTNGAMRFLNYPAKTLIKSSRVGFTMLTGLVIGKKNYRMMDYVMVSMLVFGLGIFLDADHRSKAVFHPVGVIMLVSTSIFLILL